MFIIFESIIDLIPAASYYGVTKACIIIDQVFTDTPTCTSQSYYTDVEHNLIFII